MFMTRVDEEARKAGALRRRLLAWYTANRRDLPWRRTSDPYAIWVSEIMLQQTRVAAVVERFEAFLARFPNLAALAAASEEDVLAQWSGLGYYRRARMMHRAAQVVVARDGGELPMTADELRLLPGIGTYTAAAIASIAHSQPVAVVDGNVERVLCRLAGWDTDGKSATKRKVQALAAQLVDLKRPGDFNQAMMELGATVCVPRNPQCLVCPLSEDCRTRGEHKTRRRAPMVNRVAAYALVTRARAGRGKTGMQERREVLLEQRAASQTVMPGLWELPALRSADVPPGEPRITVRHSIMQVNYTVRVRDVNKDDVTAMTVRAGRRRWVGLDDAAGMALTGLARKVLLRARLLLAPVRDQ